MYRIAAGFISGALSGVIMGFVSHILFRQKTFKSSLILVDGSFLFRTLKREAGPARLFGAGLLIHLVTSGVFGALYIVAAQFLGLDQRSVTSLGWISLYVTLLWLSMLFIALPVAGEGFLGRKSGPLAWLEQLILHVVFYVLYVILLSLLL